MTKQQIEWAKQHDWFLFNDNDTITVYVKEIEKAVTFESFKKLYEWAGY